MGLQSPQKDDYWGDLHEFAVMDEGCLAVRDSSSGILPALDADCVSYIGGETCRFSAFRSGEM